MAAKDMLKVVRDQCDRLQETAPQVPDEIIALFREKFGTTTPDVKKPEITNGLDPIFIYSIDASTPKRLYNPPMPLPSRLDIKTINEDMQTPPPSPPPDKA
jgi:hypothetical protein